MGAGPDLVDDIESMAKDTVCNRMLVSQCSLTISVAICIPTESAIISTPLELSRLSNDRLPVNDPDYFTHWHTFSYAVIEASVWIRREGKDAYDDEVSVACRMEIDNVYM